MGISRPSLLGLLRFLFPTRRAKKKNICTGPDCKQLVHRLKHINDAHNEIFTRPMRSSLPNTEIFTRLVKTGSNESAAFKGPFIERHASAFRRVMFMIEASLKSNLCEIEA